MRQPIKVGDLVQVVRGRWCCGHEIGKEGHIFTVTEIRMSFCPEWCVYCGKADVEPGALGHPGGKAIDVFSLKRIPPLDELEDVKRDEEMTV